MPTVEDLTRDAKAEVDDVLILLWDAGLDYLRGPLSPIRTTDLQSARAALSLASAKELQTVGYWLQHDAMTREELAQELKELGLTLPPNARRLPKGAIKRLRARRDSARTTTTPPAAPSPSPTTSSRPFEWQVIGKPRDLLLLSVADVEGIHWDLARDFQDGPDPMFPAGVRDSHLLASAVGRPETSLFGEKKYPTAEMSAAALMHSLVLNHPFYNGNKRTALVSMLCLLDKNGLVLQCRQDDVFKFTVRVAQHRYSDKARSADRSDVEVAAMARWIYERSRPLERDERVVTGTNLKRRLESLGCSHEMSGSNGGRLNISRTVSERTGILRREHTRRLRYQIMYRGDGREIDRKSLHDLRRELQLDEEHGIDSRDFYGADSGPDQFIAQYRKTLTRLARM